ncbi:MAG TPA: acylneuraminate cytidylyltransferase family protein [Vicinamibacteria bacterium]|jgi:N-acylneuraminate cytidylyltransferase
MNEPRAVALVPARAGSKRVRNKNVRELAGHPLLAYTLHAARESGLFAAVVVSTESPDIAAVAARYGGEVPFLRPEEMAGDVSPDIEWVDYTLRRLREAGRDYDCFSLLRPTSPFRRPDTIQRAWNRFRECADADSIRAVEKCRQHPMKMWVVEDDRLQPLIPGGPADVPWHSTPYQALPVVYAQNASLEIAWSRVVFEGRTIAGRVIAPFFTEGVEGFDINDRFDWIAAEHLLRTGEARLPQL